MCSIKSAVIFDVAIYMKRPVMNSFSNYQGDHVKSL